MAPSASNLPQDLIDEVLLRLAAKSIGRFRCVSKPWRSLLSSSKFVKSHRNFQIKSGSTTIIAAVSPEEEESPISPHLLTFTADGRSKKVTSPIFGRGRIGLYGACHGFVLIWTDCGMFVFNPVTLKALKVPKFRLPKKFKCCSYQLIGLGYDSVNDDYKVVRLSYFDRYSFCDREYDGTYVDVYSLKKKSWSRIANSPYDHHDMPYPNPVAFANGRLHWQAEGSNGYVIAAFNLAREEFEEVPRPTKDFQEMSGLVTAFGGCFAVEHSTVDEYDDECIAINIWVMKVYGVQESWNKLSINTQDMCVRFVCLSTDDELVFIEDFVNGNEKLVAYSLSTGVWRDIIVDGIPSNFLNGAEPFTECLLSPMEEESL